ncbi:hypothetical protein COCMIDRAFT_98046, partial [Bipolaris oryzae ATCC 44560]
GCLEASSAGITCCITSQTRHQRSTYAILCRFGDWQLYAPWCRYAGSVRDCHIGNC